MLNAIICEIAGAPYSRFVLTVPAAALVVLCKDRLSCSFFCFALHPHCVRFGVRQADDLSYNCKASYHHHQCCCSSKKFIYICTLSFSEFSKLPCKKKRKKKRGAVPDILWLIIKLSII